MPCGLTNSANVGFVHNLFTHSKTVGWPPNRGLAHTEIKFEKS